MRNILIYLTLATALVSMNAGAVSMQDLTGHAWCFYGHQMGVYVRYTFTADKVQTDAARDEYRLLTVQQFYFPGNSATATPGGKVQRLWKFSGDNHVHLMPISINRPNASDENDLQLLNPEVLKYGPHIAKACDDPNAITRSAFDGQVSASPALQPAAFIAGSTSRTSNSRYRGTP